MKKSVFILLLGLFIPIFNTNTSLSQNLTELSENNTKPELITEDDLPDINAFIPVDREPIPVKIIRPLYPSIAIYAGLKGKVFVRVLVDNTGKARNAIVLKSTAPIFNNYVLKSALNSTFEPAIKDGKKVAYWIVIPYSFKD